MSDSTSTLGKKPAKTPAKKSPGSYHHGELRASLIEAADIILQRDGADALSLRAIAAEVGVSHMAPYSHFKNKKELIEAVTDMGFEQLADAMTAAAKRDGTDKDLVLTYGAAYLEFAIGNPQLYRLMLGQIESRGRKKASIEKVALSNPNLSQSIKRPFKLLHSAFAATLSDEEQVANKALGAWALVHGLSALAIEERIVIPQGVSLKDFLLAVTPQR